MKNYQMLIKFLMDSGNYAQAHASAIQSFMIFFRIRPESNFLH